MTDNPRANLQRINALTAKSALYRRALNYFGTRRASADLAMLRQGRRLVSKREYEQGKRAKQDAPKEPGTAIQAA